MPELLGLVGLGWFLIDIWASILHRRPRKIRRIAQLRFGETLPSTVVEEYAILVAGPQRIVSALTGSLNQEEQAAGSVGARDQPLKERGRIGIEVVVLAQRFEHMSAQIFMCRQ